jgi:putative endonuclease
LLSEICSSGGIGRPVCLQAGALLQYALKIMFYIYALSSINRNYIYVGMTENLDDRVERHQSGREKTTRAYRPFKLIFIEELDVERKKARKREKYWKSGVGKEKLRRIRDKDK